MNRILIKSLLSQSYFFTLNKIVIKKFGLEEAAILSVLSDFESTADEDGWFYVTAKKIQDELNIGRKPYESALRNIRETGAIETKLKGQPATMHFRFDFNRMMSILDIQDCSSGTNKIAQKVQSSLPKTDKQDCPNGTTNNIYISSTDVEQNVNNNLNDSNSPTSSPITPIKIDNNNCKKETRKKRGLDLSFLESPENVRYATAMERWIEYKRSIDDMYKTQRGVEGALEDLKRACDNNPALSQQVVDICITKEWKGIYKPKELTQNGSSQQSINFGGSDKTQHGNKWSRFLEELHKQNGESMPC